MSQQIYSHRFPCGLTLVAEEMSWLESAAFALLLPGGVVRETDAQGGLASLTTELVQRGAGSRDSRQLVSDLENLGAETSASVSIAHTSLGGAMPAESLLGVLSIYSDIARRPIIPADQLEDARSACLQEVRSVEDDLAQKSMQRLRIMHYGSPWGRSSQGTLESVGGHSLEDVQNFFSNTFQPDSAILSVAGKFEWSTLKDHVGSLLADWSGTSLPPAPEITGTMGYEHIHADSSQTHIAVAFEGLPYNHPDYFQLRGAIGALSDGMSSRLFSEVREKRGLCYTVYATCHSLRDRGSIIAYSGTTAERAQETLDVLVAELHRLHDGVEDFEIQQLKRRIKRALIIQQESSPSRAGSIAYDWYHLARVRTMKELSQMVDALSSETVNHFLADHRPSKFTIVTVGPKPLIPPV